MSFPVLENSAQTKNGNKALNRPTADFPPPIWGDRFSNYVAEDKISVDRKEQRIKELKEEVKREIKATAVNPSHQLKLIDDIQRLGVGYHFEKEIEEALQHMYETHHDYQVNNADDLYNASLRFRLLRQQGFNISCDILNKFKDNNENFSETLIGDTLGMLSLYEATFFRKHEEDILDKALVFTSSHLRRLMETDRLSNPLASQVDRALYHPLRKGIPRLEERYYMSIYHEIDSPNKALLELAKLDFNLLQSLHKKELSDITRWWNDLDFATKLTFARNRIVELYFWTLAVYTEPKYSRARIIVTKVIAMTSYLDDIYDSYGSDEELELFTNAIQRWDINSMDQLPEYMRFFYQELLDIYEGIEQEMAKEGRLYRAYYAKEAMKRQAKYYFLESKWLKEEYVPTFEEYMKKALMTSGYPLLSLSCFIGVGETATKEVFDWVFNVPEIVRASSCISRLLDDISSYKFEQKRKHIASAVECYMKEYDASEDQAVKELRKLEVKEWKIINECCLKPTDQDVPLPLLMLIVNLTRAGEAFYKEGDGLTKVGKEMRARIAMMLIDPVPI